jgi:transcriptional repressor NrdR
MKCPFCQHSEQKVTDSRDSPDMKAIKRRRECLSCGKRFTTFETLDLTLQVHKRDGRYEEFQLTKLIKGLDAACHHTTISHEKVLELASEIASDLLGRQKSVVESQELGELAIEKLQSLDPIAYIRFACVYRRFKEIRELEEAIRAIR